MTLNLLYQPDTEELKRNYMQQLDQTIAAYLPSFIFLGEALQNALDAVRMAGGTGHEITVEIDLANRSVTVTDDGIGFPSMPALLFLGGGLKKGKGLGGLVGVGMKVVMFSSRVFEIRSRTAETSVLVHVEEAHKYADDKPPSLELPDKDHLPVDPSPFTDKTGTRLSYSFPEGADAVPERFFRDIHNESLAGGPRHFAAALDASKRSGAYPNRLAALLAAYLRRFTYVGSTNPPAEYKDLTIKVKIDASDSTPLGELSDLVDGKKVVEFTVEPSYLTVEATVPWEKGPRPSIFSTELGDGGGNLQRADKAFNITRYETPDELASLITNSWGKQSDNLERYKGKLFPKINSVTVTIGRIPLFEKYLPGGSRRVISSRGVTTTHDLNITKGQNQQYVRCLDIVVDVDANLNYGKTQLTDMHLVSNINRFIDDAYARVLQKAAKNFVGNPPKEDTTEEKFWERTELNLPGLSQLRTPYDENDAIALFFELKGMGHFPEFRWFGLSQRDRYDGRAVISKDSSRSDLLSNPKKEDLCTVEFKLRGASITRDFDTEQKDQKDVDLIICYEPGVPKVNGFQVIDVKDSDLYQSDSGVFPHTTHVLYHAVSGRETEMLSLATLLPDLLGAEAPSLAPEAEDEDE